MGIAEDRRAQFRQIAYNARRIPGDYGLRPFTVVVLSGAWSGSYTGRGAETVTSVAITEAGGQPPKVRFARNEEIALGNLESGDAIIGPITPYFGTGGTTLSQIAPAVNAGQTVHVVLTGPGHETGTKYRIKQIDTDRALHWTVTCVPVSRA